MRMVSTELMRLTAPTVMRPLEMYSATGQMRVRETIRGGQRRLTAVRLVQALVPVLRDAVSRCRRFGWKVKMRAREACARETNQCRRRWRSQLRCSCLETLSKVVGGAGARSETLNYEESSVEVSSVSAFGLGHRARAFLKQVRSPSALRREAFRRPR
jgi:hypothetical protein